MSFGMALLSSVTFGLVGIALTLLGYKMFDWLAPKIDVQEELAQKGHIAVAIVVAAMILGVAMVVSAAVS
jgi:putative membrane protein